MVAHTIIILYFIIKELAEQLEGQCECLEENRENYVTFSVPVKKELDNGKTITYKIKFIDSFRLFQAHYRVLLIIYLKRFIIISVQIAILSLIPYQLKIVN